MSSLENYWDVKPKQVLYSRDTYHKEHTVDVFEFLKVGIVVSTVATLVLLGIGMVMVVL